MSFGTPPSSTDTARRPGTFMYRPPRSLTGATSRTVVTVGRPDLGSQLPPEPPAPQSPVKRSAAPENDKLAGTRTGKKRILVVDDEKDLVEMVAYNLRRNGYDAFIAENGLEAIEIATREIPDLVILDLMLPGIDGTEVARRLKADSRTQNIPIIMLTAKAEETDVIVGLTLGADDYVTKPFSMKILLARLTSVLRRVESGSTPADADGTLKAGPLTIDTSKHEVLVEGEIIRLTLTEFRLLSALVSARGRVLTRDQLMDKAMGADVFVTDRAIDVHITAIRKKLGIAHYLVHTVRGVGYRLQETPEEGT